MKSNPNNILKQNVIKGKVAEEIAKQDYKENGFEIIETGVGSDFIVSKKISSESRYMKYVDVKSGNSKLSKTQKKTKSQLKKKGIPYSIYRVTDKFLLSEISSKTTLRKILENANLDITVFDGRFIINDPTSCPNCKLVSSGLESIIKYFGLRNMGNGIVNVQSWCRNCRNYSGRGRR